MSTQVRSPTTTGDRVSLFRDVLYDYVEAFARWTPHPEYSIEDATGALIRLCSHIFDEATCERIVARHDAVRTLVLAIPQGKSKKKQVTVEASRGRFV